MPRTPKAVAFDRLTPRHWEQLTKGFMLSDSGDGYVRSRPPHSINENEWDVDWDSMRADWEELGPQVMENWLTDDPYNACHRPHAWWLFSSDAGERTGLQQDEPMRLLQAGELTTEEMELWIAKHPSHPTQSGMFRRPAAWWGVQSPEPRDWDMSEVCQIVAMQARYGNTYTEAERTWLTYKPATWIYDRLGLTREEWAALHPGYLPWADAFERRDWAWLRVH